MKGNKTVHVQRRAFLTSAPLLILSAGALKAFPFASQGAPKGPELSEALNPAEQQIADQSAMSRDMENFWGKGYSCAETGLAVALRFMKKPEELVWAAGGFGGGMGHQDLCGFLTSGIMAIGLYTGNLNSDKKAAKALCSRKVNEYWTWWKSMAPLHCAEIREGHTDFNVCHRLGRLAAAELEGLLKT